MQIMPINVFTRRLKAVGWLLKDKTVQKRKKAIAIAGIVYFLSPIDIIPTILFPFSLIDDLIIWTCILNYLGDDLDQYWGVKKEGDLSKSFRGKTVINEVQYEVKEEKREG